MTTGTITAIEGQERRGRHVGPDGEGNDGQAREKEVGERRRLCHHGDERDRERDDRDQAAKRVGLEPPWPDSAVTWPTVAPLSSSDIVL